MKPIHIAVSCDDLYVNHTITGLNSLFQHHKELEFYIHILTSKISLKNNIKLLLFFQRNKVNYKFHKVDYSLLNKAPVTHHISLASYNRIFLSSLLDNEIDQVVYLDSDIVVNGPINELFESNISDYFIAAVEEKISNSDKQRLDLESDAVYFNAGILVINLKKWRQDEIEKRFLNFIINHPQKIKYWDQDVLNHCLKNNWLKLPKYLNLTHFYFYPKDFPASYFDLSEVEYAEIKKNARIIHFTGHKKPWIEGCDHPKAELYFKYELSLKKLLLDILLCRKR